MNVNNRSAIRHRVHMKRTNRIERKRVKDIFAYVSKTHNFSQCLCARGIICMRMPVFVYVSVFVCFGQDPTNFGAHSGKWWFIQDLSHWPCTAYKMIHSTWCDGLFSYFSSMCLLNVNVLNRGDAPVQGHTNTITHKYIHYTRTV